MFKDKFVTLPGELRVSKLMECDTFCLQYFDTVGWDRNTRRWWKEVWEGVGVKPHGVWGWESPSGVQGWSPSRESGGQSPLEAEEFSK